MHCAHCGAPIQREAADRGACPYCGTVIEREQEPSVERGVAEIMAALGSGRPIAAGQHVVHSVTTHASTTFVVDGKTYARIEDMPPDVRARFEEKMAKLEAMGLIPKRR